MEICNTNAQFLSSFGQGSSSKSSASNNNKNSSNSSSNSSSKDDDDEIRKVADKYNKLIGNIKASGRKCLDIADEQLRTDFQVLF